ncbi:MAG: GNAT family N-acetyltransferase [Bacteroidales bacterium]|nr:GNAT family N-acetyltransferase [Bacteroidales bacterium]
MTEVVSFNFDDKALIALSSAIRKEVFVEEQHVDIKLEYDGKDKDAKHYLLFYNKKAIATARWRNTSAGIKLERFAMLKLFRNQGLGVHLLKAVMADVLKNNQPIYLHSQDKAVNFYKRHGFKIEGDAFIEAGIVHYKMVWE